MQIAKPGGGLSKKKGRETQEGGMAFRIGVKLHSDISVAPSQPTDLLGWDTQVRNPQGGTAGTYLLMQ